MGANVNSEEPHEFPLVVEMMLAIDSYSGRGIHFIQDCPTSMHILTALNRVNGYFKRQLRKYVGGIVSSIGGDEERMGLGLIKICYIHL